MTMTTWNVTTAEELEEGDVFALEGKSITGSSTYFKDADFESEARWAKIIDFISDDTGTATSAVVFVRYLHNDETTVFSVGLEQPVAVQVDVP